MPLRLGVFAIVVLAASFAMFKSLGGDVPGPHIFHSLGLSEGYHVKLCTPSAGTTRVPAAPPPAPGAWRAEPPTPTVGTELMAGASAGPPTISAGRANPATRSPPLARTTRPPPATAPAPDFP